MTAVARRAGAVGRSSAAPVLHLRRGSRRAARWRAYLCTGWLPAGHRHRPEAGPGHAGTPKALAPNIAALLSSRTTWDVASKLNRTLAPVAVTLDVARLGLAARRDRGLGRNVARTGASMAGSWAGGYAGGVAGSHAGAMIGSVGGPVGALVGGLTGALVGAVAGAVGLSKVSEQGADWAASLHDGGVRGSGSRRRRLCGSARRGRQHNCLRRRRFGGPARGRACASRTEESPDTERTDWITLGPSEKQRSPAKETPPHRDAATGSCVVAMVEYKRTERKQDD